MDLDDLKQTWAAHDGKLDAVLRINRELLTANRMDRARSALWRLAVSLGFEACLALVPVLLLGSFAYDTRHAARFLLPAAALEVCALGYLAVTLRHLVAVVEIDYGQPVAQVQRQVETLRAGRARLMLWILVGSPLAWTPLVVVVLRALGVDAYRIPGMPWRWLVANLLFGVGMVAAAVWASRRFAHRMAASPLVQRLMNDLAGYNLRAASRSLKSLADFEQEQR